MKHLIYEIKPSELIRYGDHGIAHAVPPRELDEIEEALFDAQDFILFVDFEDIAESARRWSNLKRSTRDVPPHGTKVKMPNAVWVGDYDTRTPKVIFADYGRRGVTLPTNCSGLTLFGCDNIRGIAIMAANQPKSWRKRCLGRDGFDILPVYLDSEIEIDNE